MLPVHCQVENLENERHHCTGTKCSGRTRVADTHFKSFVVSNGHRDQCREYVLGDDLAVRYFVEDPDQMVGEKIDHRRYSVRRQRQRFVDGIEILRPNRSSVVPLKQVLQVSKRDRIKRVERIRVYLRPKFDGTDRIANVCRSFGKPRENSVAISQRIVLWIMSDRGYRKRKCRRKQFVFVSDFQYNLSVE